MDGQCCRYEPSFDDLLADDVMEPVLRSAGFDADAFREMLVETARRMDDRLDGRMDERASRDEGRCR